MNQIGFEGNADGARIPYGDAEIQFNSGGSIELNPATAGYVRVGKKKVTAHTADFDLEATDSGTAHTTDGAAGTVVCSLPAATVGLEFFFYVGAAQELRIDPDGTETISLPSTGVAGAAGKYLTANAVGETVHILCCEAGTWACIASTGTWTSE